MENSLSIQLLHETIDLPDMSIGQAMDIAHIPQEFNEKRLSSMITHLSGDSTLAARLTAQERYHVLLNHQMVMQSHYSDDVGNADYMIDSVRSDIPDNWQVGDMTVHHLRGAHVCVLEGICENAYDWLCGQMACQLSGDLTFFVGGDDEGMRWDELPASMSDAELNKAIQERVAILGNLSSNSRFNDIVSGYTSGTDQLEHFVSLGCANDGLTLIKKGGDGAGMPARFLTLDGLQGIARTLAQCLA